MDQGNAALGAVPEGGAWSEGNSAISDSAVMTEVADFKRCFEDFCASLLRRGERVMPILQEMQASGPPSKDVHFWANFYQICVRYAQTNNDQAAQNQPRMPPFSNSQDEFSQPMPTQNLRSPQQGPTWHTTSDLSQDEFPMPLPRVQHPQGNGQMDARQQRMGCYGNSGCLGGCMGGSNGALIVSRYNPSPDIDIQQSCMRASPGSRSADQMAGSMRAHVSLQPAPAVSHRVQEWTLPNLDNMVLERFQELSDRAGGQPQAGPCM